MLMTFISITLHANVKPYLLIINDIKWLIISNSKEVKFSGLKFFVWKIQDFSHRRIHPNGFYA